MSRPSCTCGRSMHGRPGWAYSPEHQHITFHIGEAGFCPHPGCGDKLLPGGGTESRAELEAKAAALDKLEGTDLEWSRPSRCYLAYLDEGVYGGDTLRALAEALPEAPKGDN